MLDSPEYPPFYLSGVFQGKQWLNDLNGENPGLLLVGYDLPDAKANMRARNAGNKGTTSRKSVSCGTCFSERFDCLILFRPSFMGCDAGLTVPRIIQPLLIQYRHNIWIFQTSPD